MHLVPSEAEGFGEILLESTYARVARFTATSQVEGQRLFNNQNTICRSECRKRSKKEYCQHEWTNNFFAVASSVVRRQSYNDLSRGQVPTLPLSAFSGFMLENSSLFEGWVILTAM